MSPIGRDCNIEVMTDVIAGKDSERIVVRTKKGPGWRCRGQIVEVVELLIAEQHYVRFRGIRVAHNWFCWGDVKTWRDVKVLELPGCQIRRRIGPDGQSQSHMPRSVDAHLMPQGGGSELFKSAGRFNKSLFHVGTLHTLEAWSDWELLLAG
jgi:hypothetical protein